MLAWWQGSELTLAVSVACRGLAIPVAWRIKTGGRPGPWMPDLCDLPVGWAEGMTVRVLCDRGLQSPDLWKAIRERKRRCTLIVLWVPGQEAPWVVPADEAPDDVDLGAYGMRVWIEQGFRTRRLDPDRGDRPWNRRRPGGIFQLGWGQAQRLLHRSYGWARVWLQPLPGPDPPEGMQRVAPPVG